MKSRDYPLMSKKIPLVPKLRFPEFAEEGEWEIRNIEKNIDLVSGIALKSNEISEDKNGTPILRGINITEGRIRHSEDIDRYFLKDTSNLGKYLIEENDIVISMDGSKVGKNVALITKKDEGSILIQRVARIKAVNADINYLFQHFLSYRFRNYVDTVNTSSGIPHISAKQICDYEISFPKNTKEQQKIASCLSSLDQLIVAQKQKLVVLKDHKKGLMQNLFPKEGQKVPHYRFPKFEKEGEWVEKKLNFLFYLQDGYAFSSKMFTSDSENARQVIRITEINNHNKNLEKVFIKEDRIDKLAIDKHVVNKGDLLLSLTGASGFNFYIWESEKAYINQRTMKLLLKDPENDSLKILLNPLIHKKINCFGSGQNNNLSKEFLKDVEFLSPKNTKEQQKIASCLSALDQLITAQSEKVEQLEQHKKGLMQTLFPKP